ncbi:MAG: formylglycine-generating enzyme family protein [Spirochaetia bacterium]
MKRIAIISSLIFLLVLCFSCEQRRDFSVDMVFVEGGSFMMGSPPSDYQRWGNETPHEVELTSFYISPLEVTQELYQDIMGENPSEFQAGEEASQRPVENISWYDAVAFCNGLSEREGFVPAYYSDPEFQNIYTGGEEVYWNRAANGYRLPTEAEWEYAARGGALSEGYLYSGSETLDEIAWYQENSGDTTHAVGTRQANELGLYDMTGNVWEKCWDWAGLYDTEDTLDPVGAQQGRYRVFRGGSFESEDRRLRVANRGANFPDTVSEGIGLRVAANIEPEE